MKRLKSEGLKEDTEEFVYSYCLFLFFPMETLFGDYRTSRSTRAVNVAMGNVGLDHNKGLMNTCCSTITAGVKRVGVKRLVVSDAHFWSPSFFPSRLQLCFLGRRYVLDLFDLRKSLQSPDSFQCSSIATCLE